MLLVNGVSAGRSSSQGRTPTGTPTTANTPPGHTAKSPKPLDELRPWDVYSGTAKPNGNKYIRPCHHRALEIRPAAFLAVWVWFARADCGHQVLVPASSLV
jgi:hypothetical protein